MGEVGGYQLHLYCDHPDHDHTDFTAPYVKGFGEFYGARSLTNAREEAHLYGWRRRSWPQVTRGTEPTWVCPECVDRPAPTTEGESR